MEKNDELNKFAKELQDSFTQHERDNLDSILQLKDIRLFGHLLLEREAKRLSKKLGSEHPRVQAIRTNLQRNQETIEELSAQHEVANIEVPEPEENGSLFHGRITDEHGIGVAGANVVLTEVSGKELPIEGGVTNNWGYFAISLNAEMAEQIKDRPLNFKVLSIDDRLLYEHKESMRIAAGKNRLVSSVIYRDLLYPKATIAEKLRKKEKKQKEDFRKKTRFLGNTNSKELHDLTNEKKGCNIDAINPEHRMHFKKKEEAIAKQFDYCAYCFGKGKSKR